jgi:hypothetical protein
MKSFFVLLLLVSANVRAGGWGSESDPANMGKNYNYSFSDLPLAGTVDPKHMPWSDNYWESDWGGISLRWETLTVAQRDPDLYDYQTVNKSALFAYAPPSLSQLRTMSRQDLLNLSPAEKYDIMMGRYDYPTVYSERQRTSPDMKDWQGICHGWVPAAINQAEPLPTDMTNPDGVVVPFGSSDVKGLLSYYYGVTAYDYARGSRTVVRSGSIFEYLDAVDTFDPISWIKLAADALVYDSRGLSVLPYNENDSAVCADTATAGQYGSTANCVKSFAFEGNVDSLDIVSQVGARSSGSDPNPGAFHIVMANQLGLMHQAFVGNINLSGSKTQIWNQPVSGYSSVVTNDKRSRHGGQVDITTTLSYVSEIPQNYDVVLNTPNERVKTVDFKYTLELDDAGNITGGEWHGFHPSFIWSHGKLPLKGYFSKLNSIYKPRSM